MTRTGSGITVTVVEATAVQVFNVPVMVYTCVAAGDAVTTLPVAALSPVAGLQV